MARFFIFTLGCKVNRSESDETARTLLSKGWKWAENGPADIVDACIINTCTVTSKAAMQSRQAARRMLREHPRAAVYVTGCHAQIAKQELERISPRLTVVGLKEKQDLARRIHEDFLGAHPAGSLARDENSDDASGVVLSPGRTRQVVKIQDGCNAFCTYCIVPYARGRSRSLSPEQVLDRIFRLSAAGCREVVLSGIHLGYYGKDLNPPVTLAALVEQAARRGGVDRIRLSSIEPMELDDDLIALAARPGPVCPHFHIPLQSGEDGVLKRMKRPYTAGFFERLVEKIAKSIPFAAMGVDVMTGFPGETDAAFGATFQLISRLPVTYLHVFPFSPRQGTAAAGFADPVPREKALDRAGRLRVLGREKKEAFFRKNLSRVLDVLPEEKRDRETGLLKGLTPNYIPVLFKGPDQWMNKPVRVELKNLDRKNRVMGEPV